MPNPRPSSLRAVLADALDLAERDPDALVDKSKKVLRGVGREAERYYAAYQGDPELRRLVRNKLIQIAARMVR